MLPAFSMPKTVCSCRVASADEHAMRCLTGVAHWAWMWIFLSAAACAAPASIMERMQTQRIAQLGIDASMEHGDAWLASQLLEDPQSPYSASIAQPGFTNETWWAEVVASLPEGTGEADALNQLRQEFGATRARPGVDVTVSEHGFRDSFVAAHAIKAGLDADIFWHMLDVFGYERARRLAGYAMGLQLLREQVTRVPIDRQLDSGIDGDVVARFFRATQPSHISTRDIRYLNILVQHGLLHPARGPGIPLPWRIARSAAAFRDAEGYLYGPPCRPDATPNPTMAGSGAESDLRTPCLVAATDRAVHRWHVAELRRPMIRETHAKDSMAAKLGMLVGALLPLLDMMALAEIVEAAIADDMVTANTLSRADADILSARATRLTCVIPE